LINLINHVSAETLTIGRMIPFGQLVPSRRIDSVIKGENNQYLD